MSQPKPNMAKRFCILTGILAGLAATGFFALINYGRANSGSVTPEFYSRVGEVMGGFMGLSLALCALFGVLWLTGAKKPR
jgi:hypothetical protein